MPESRADLPPYLTTEQVAHLLQLHVNTVKAMCRSGQMPAVKLGNVWRIDRGQLTARLQCSQGQSPDDAPGKFDGPDECGGLAAQQTAILDSMADGVVVYDLQGRIVRMNAVATTKLGYSPETQALPITARSQAVLQPLRPDGTAFAPADFPAARALRGEVVRDEEMILHVPARAGGDLRVRVTSAPIRAATGEISGCVTTFTDIGELHAVSAALSRSQTQLLILQDSIPALVWSSTGTGEPDYVNRPWQEYTGISLEEYVARGWEAVNHPDDLESIIALWRTAAVECRPFEAEFRYRRFDGSYRWFWGRAVPLLDEAGRIVRWVGAATDIDARKQAEAIGEAARQVLHEANEQLERRVRERTAELALQADRLAILHEIDHAILAARAPAEIAQVAAERIRQAAGAVRVTVGTFDQSANEAEVLAVAGPASEETPPRCRRPLFSLWGIEETLAGRAATVTDIACLPDGDPYKADRLRQGIRSSTFVPMAVNARVIGSVAISRAEPGALAADVMDLATHVADSLAIAIHNAHLNEELAHDRAALATANEQLRYQADLLENVGEAVVATDEHYRVTAFNRGAEELYGWQAAEVIGRPVVEVFRTEFVGTSREQARQDLLARDQWRGEVIVYRRDGSAMYADSRSIVLRDGSGRIIGHIGVNRDISERKRVEQALAESQRRLQVLYGIDQGIIAAHTAEQIGQASLPRIRDLIGCQRASLMIFEDQTATLLAVDAESLTQLPAGSVIPLSQAKLPVEFAAGLPHVENDLENVQNPSPATLALLAEGVRSHLSLPLMPEGKVIGCLNLAATVPGLFMPQTVQLVRQIAASLALRLHRFLLIQRLEQSQRELRQLSHRMVALQEQDRRAIARELHDESGQALTALMIALGTLRRRRDLPDDVCQSLETLLCDVDGVMQGLHRLAANLRPVSLDRFGLASSISQHARNLTEQHGIPVSFDAMGFEEDGRLPPDVETAIYRIVQEACTNAIRHAQPAAISIILQRHPDHALAIVEDDGLGFDLESAACKGRLGLVGMRERAEMLRGTLIVESAPGKGTTVYVDLPCSPGGEGD